MIVTLGTRHHDMVRTRAAERQSVPASSRRNLSQFITTHATRTTTRPRRSQKASISYNESSSEDGDSEPSLAESEQDGDAQFETRARRTSKARSAKTAHVQTGRRSNSRDQTRKRPKPAQKKGSLKKRRVSADAEPGPIPQGVIPDWTDPQIPYAAWTDIFYYAASHDDIDVNWLINTATTCKAFSEAALTAIYRSPPLVTAGKAKRFASLLDRPPSETRFNYRAKIETLFVDIHVLPQTLLPRILHLLPRLKEVFLFTQSDQPPYRQLDQTVRWQYTEEIFAAFRPAGDKESHTVLKSWEWSGSLLGGPVATMKDVARIHQEPSFAHLTKLSLTNLQVPSLYKLGPKGGNEEEELALYNEDGAVIDSLAEAISQLKSLQHLMFESSTVMNDRLLPLLPKDLTHLSLINCWEVKSDEFMPFLHTHGRHLRSLNLSHNQSLDMVFLTNLEAACPNLEELYMNLSYFRHHESRSYTNNDADPLYDQVLLPYQKPEWPSSLRIIDFEHIRYWSVETAEMFLNSLIDSAGSLPNLRHLAVKTMLNIPWKARANMRHEWRRKLDKVFLRPYEPPQRKYSLRQTQEEEVEASTQISEKKKQKSKRLSDGPSRRSSRLAAQVSDSDSRNSAKGLRNSLGRPTYAEPDTDENEFDSDAEDEEAESGTAVSQTGDEAESEKKPVPLMIQGRCTTVSIVFDNQKPTELQYGMEDFVDDDRAESDDEWDGDHEEDDDAVFVWR
ncbi:hypothetical protein IWW34DRAFT_834021 [Fusarium oxysporum f. sp. albedinis]|nr:hypothetical protein IWW34DRAFT_834021 [Fusarium oxysporum f. sp. albedinis]KAK2475302.1 hypothetical protein H9L39_12895 [Fusarium oxysporum f. sp. albedinis]